MKYDVEGIKGAVQRHVVETLRDCNPFSRHKEMAEQRKEVIASAITVQKLKRFQTDTDTLRRH